MEETSARDRKLRPLAYVITASFLLGSFSGAAFGVLFAVSLNEKTYPWRATASESTSTVNSQLSTVAAEDRQVISAVRRASPSVVSIVVSKDIAKLYNRTGPFAFEPFFGLDLPDAPQAGRKQQVGGGTGFVISADGLILTNRHVVADAEADYEAVTADGRAFPAEVLAIDGILDLAVLKIEAQGLTTATLGGSDRLETGETVIAIGNALSEYSNSVTKGVISGINRRVVAGDGFGDSEVIEEAIQTDAAINPGNSGGPLIDLRGEVVGVNTAVNRSGQSIGFAIPIDAAKIVIESIRTHGRIVRPWLGVRYVMLTPESAEAGGLPAAQGALIVGGGAAEGAAVLPGSPAEKAGIQAGDILLAVDGVTLGKDRPLSGVISRKRAGDTVEIRLLRERTERIIIATLGELPEVK